jgi:hypothetical protein
MDYKDKVKEMFSYLLNVKNLNEKIIRNIWDYEKLYWESELLKTLGCSVNKNSSKEWWLKVNKKCKRLYDQFLRLYLELEKREQNSEIVWGHGLMVWKFHGQKIVHPILTTRMKLNFDAENEAFTLTQNSRTGMETNIFDGIDIPNLTGILQVENKLNNISLDPRNIEDIEKILTEVASYLSADGRVEKEDISVDKVSLLEDPIIYDTPVILIRKNNMRLWQREINNIISEIDKGYPIPQTIKALVEDIKIEQNEKNSQEWKDVSKDLFFPLCANYEQKEIIKRVSDNYGVVVQGGPGTGKSHTIVNLISHLLAHGKRVLVTSETDRALKVLTDKIPEQIKPLCLSVLGNDNNSLAELNESVKKIIDNMSADPQKLHEEIGKLKGELELCRKNQNLLCIKFKQSQKRENENIKFNNQEYKIIDIAKWVKENENKYSWIEDEIRLEQGMPLSQAEFEKLIGLLKEVNKDYKKNLESMTIMLDKLPSSNEICNSVYRFKELHNNHENYIKAINGWRVPDNNRCNYDNLLNLLEECKARMKEMDKDVFINILEKYYSSKIIRESLKDVAHKCNDYMVMLGKIKSELRSHKVEIPNNIRFNKDFDVIYESLSLRGKIGKIFRFIHPECNYIIKECKVDGRNLETLEQVLIVKLYMQEKFIFKELKNLWNNIMKVYGGKLILSEGKELGLILIEEYVKKLNIIVNWDKNYKSQITLMLGKISVPENIDWHKKDTYDYLIKSVQCIKKLEEYNNLKAYIEILKKLFLNTGKVSELKEAVEELNISKIKIALNKIESFNRIKSKALELDKLLSKLRIICPITAKKIISKWGECEESFKDWKNAWKWAKWHSLLREIYNSNLDLIEVSMEEEKRREKMLIEQIISKKTWHSQILRTSESEKRSLFSWMQAVKRIGKGTGKMVSEYRKIAQNEMEKCKETIPVWIMPLNRVIENVTISENLFDVIIFDESSQSDIFSICALMRAKKAVIVGDDKQISPESIGIDQGLIQSLISKHLKNIPQREWFDLQTSLYETALRVFPNRLILKEHFRCLPEIIGFGNNEFYSNEIKQLRYPKSYEEFYPTIVPIRVSEGYREQHKAINIPEAEFLVNKLVECCKDKRYLGMTMGAISLLGEQQSQLIENMIRERIGEEEIIKRKIVCGDAYAFQGDERDIMFLSMVVSKDVKFTSITKECDIRRFNVATSRARNQMWVFYSIDLDDINPECIRYSLLKYCLNYKKKNNRYKKVEFAFMTKFQRDVYELIKNKGYFVESDVKLGSYKIDFVIEGMKNRVAIVCDGDINIDKYDWEEGIERKLDLERLGWTFCRIRGSEFYYDSEKAMEKLWSELRESGEDIYISEKSIIQNLKVV